MIGATRMGHRSAASARAVAGLALLLALAMLAACTSTARLGGNTPDQAAATPPPPPPPAPPPPQPPPVDLAGKWKFSMAGGGACVMTLGNSAGAVDGTVAPAGGCPGNFFTSRKWTFEHDRLILRDHKGTALVELSFADGRFQGQGASGAVITLAR
jgi:hypothetical protein